MSALTDAELRRSRVNTDNNLVQANNVNIDMEPEIKTPVTRIERTYTTEPREMTGSDGVTKTYWVPIMKETTTTTYE